MTEQEMCELDAWIAEHGYMKGLCQVIGSVQEFTVDPAMFETVKREIERRGWRWGGESHPDGWYWFRIWKEETTSDIQDPDSPPPMSVVILGEGYERSEELAGYLAFKAAVETTG